MHSDNTPAQGHLSAGEREDCEVAGENVRIRVVALQGGDLAPTWR